MAGSVRPREDLWKEKTEEKCEYLIADENRKQDGI
jgi:hypothetical protein